MSANTALATRSQSQAPAEVGIRKMIQSDLVKEQLAAALPRFYTPEQFVVIVRTAINKNPKLADCTKESFMVALLTAAQMGIAPDGRNGHLIPRNRKLQSGEWIMEATFQPDYKGLVGLIRRNNENVADVYAELVHDKDHILVTKGLKRDLIHEVDIRADRGDLIGVYAVITYKDGTSASFEYMSRAEVEKVRARSDSWKSHVSKGYDTPWLTDEGEMFKKTVLKRLLKLADLSEDTTDRLNVEPEQMPLAQAVEIKPASIPLPAATDPEPTPALPERAAPIEAELVSEPKAAPVAPVPAEKPAPAPKAVKSDLKKKATPAPDPVKDPAAPHVETKPVDPHADLVRQVQAKLSEAGHTEKQLIRACINNEWGVGFQQFTVEATELADIDKETLESFLEGETWVDVVLPELVLVAKSEEAQ